jgi:hypothetical protein
VSVRPGTMFTAAQVGDRVGLPTSAAGRVLEDLAAHGVAERHSGYRGAQHGWTASQWLRDRWDALDLSLEQSRWADEPDASARDREERW